MVRKLAQRRRWGRGMTLLEMLVVVAILALVVVALIFLLRPSDDQRCKMEAERLAAWLLSARAEAVMRDGPVRAAFDFSPQTVTRELGKEGASLVELRFQKDDRSEVFKTREPVAYLMLRIPLLGDLSGGVNWMVFNGHKTLGGVVVLGLNEVRYSVVVGPGAEGAVEVVRGVADVPKAPKLQTSLLIRPDFTLDTSPFAPDFIPPVGQPPMDEPLIPPAGGPQNPPQDPPQDPPSTQPPPMGGGAPPPNPPQDPPQDPPEEDPDEPEEDPECRIPDIPCPGRFEACIEERCVASPTDVALRVISAQVTEPAAVAAVLQPIFQKEIMEGRFNLTVKFIAPVDQNNPDGDFMAAVVQAALHPSGAFVPNSLLPSYMQMASRMQQCSGYTHCYELSVEKDLRLYVKRAHIRPGECAFNTIAIAGRASAYLDLPQGAQMSSQITGTISVFGMLEGAVAQQTMFKLPNGQMQGLDELLFSYGAAPTVDTNGDGVADSWQFQLEGTAAGVDMPFIQADPSRDPCY